MKTKTNRLNSDIRREQARKDFVLNILAQSVNGAFGAFIIVAAIYFGS